MDRREYDTISMGHRYKVTVTEAEMGKSTDTTAFEHPANAVNKKVGRECRSRVGVMR